MKAESAPLLGKRAGKARCKIMSGDLKADEGIFAQRRESQFSDPQEAIAAGISVIYQERQLIPTMSVMKTISGALPKTKLGLFDKRRLYNDRGNH